MSSIHGSDIASLEPYQPYSTADTIPILAKGDTSLNDPSGVAKQITLATIISAAQTGSGVQSVTFTGDGTVLSSTPSAAVTTTGTLDATLAHQAANVVLAGPTTGSSTAPTFRALVAADLPGGSGTVSSVTFTGDGTVLSSTPSSAVTTTGTVTAALANAAAYTLLGNDTGSAAVPTYVNGLMGFQTLTAASTTLTAASPSHNVLNTASNAVIAVLPGSEAFGDH